MGDGFFVGFFVGRLVGFFVGRLVGFLVAFLVGRLVGLGVSVFLGVGFGVLVFGLRVGVLVGERVTIGAWVGGWVLLTRLTVWVLGLGLGRSFCWAHETASNKATKMAWTTKDVKTVRNMAYLLGVAPGGSVGMSTFSIPAFWQAPIT